MNENSRGMILIKNVLLIFSVFISFVLFDKTSGIISYTKDNNELLMINLTVFTFLVLIIFFLKKTVFTNNMAIFISIVIVSVSLTTCLTYYINYKFGKSRIENCVIKDKLVDIYPKDRTIKTYKIHLDCDEFPFVIVNKDFFDKVEKEMEVCIVLNDGILGFSVLKGIKGKNDDSLQHKLPS